MFRIIIEIPFKLIIEEMLLSYKFTGRMQKFWNIFQNMTVNNVSIVNAYVLVYTFGPNLMSI